MQIVFNLYPVRSQTLYLPAAYLVQHDQDGTLTYMSQRAIPATCAPYNIEVTPELKRLFDLADLLTPKAIEAKFKPPKAKLGTPLAELLDPKNPTRATVESYLYRTLDRFYTEVVRQGYPMALDGEKRTLVKDVQIHIAQEELVPHLSFKRTAEAIEYRLQLGTEIEKFPIHQHDVLPLTNTDPAWLLIGYTLFRVSGINGRMVNPFRNKDVVSIPAGQVKVYFKTFIAKNAGRNQIEAEGFEVQTAKDLLRTHLHAVEDILQKTWSLKPVFEYQNAQFDHGDKRDNITTVEFEDKSDSVLVKKIARDWPKEKESIAVLEKNGLQMEGRTSPCPESLHGNAALVWWVRWLANHRKALEKAGFVLHLPQVDGKEVALLPGSIELHTEARNDWFDVHGQVVAGEHTFGFKELLPHLRQHDPFFPLPDGTYFLIPEEWFTRYSDLAKALRDTPDGAQLPKALFTLLDATGEESLTQIADFPIIDPEMVEYVPGPELRATLRPYQVYGVKWMIGHYNHGFGTCLADSMGLGKTLQTIAVLLHAKSQRPELPETPPQPIEQAPAAPAAKGFQLDLFNPVQQEAITVAENAPSGSGMVLQMAKTYPALVILPASLVFNWQKELEQFAPSLFVRAHVGAQRERDPRALAMHDVVLTTYHTARLDLDMLSKVDWHFIILDESQQIKNRDSEISKVVRQLEAYHKISLSGTPIENSLADLWTQMEFINPSTLGSYAAFKEQFQVPIERHGDPVARAQLFSRVRPFFLRRTKEEVAPDLPPKIEQVFYSEMSSTQRSRYEEVKSAVRNEILELFDDPKTRLLAIQALTRLRQLANHPILADKQYEGDSGKLDDVLAQWETLRKDGHKVLFFSSFTQHLQIYRGIFEKEKIPYAWLTGETPQADRGGIIERFQTDDKVQAFFCSIKAGGVGLNLTAADFVFLLDPWWNPAAEDQAIARAHRIGQTRPVNAIRFISRDTIEEKIRAMQERKKALSDGLFVTDREVPEFTREDLVELLG
jgi:superfamily II DNA or RNA helicase